MKKTVALIFGGVGVERYVSMASAYNLLGLIDKDKYNILPVGIGERGDFYIYKGSPDLIKDGRWEKDVAHLFPTSPMRDGGVGGFLGQGREIIGVDIAVPCMHGEFGEDGRVAGLLECLGIKSVAEDWAVSVICADKAYTKLIAKSIGIKTADWVYANGLDTASALSLSQERIGYPMFIKPARLGSSFGAHPVLNKEDFEKYYEETCRIGMGRVLIEKLIDVDCETECAYLGVGDGYFNPGGVIKAEDGFYDYDKKYKKDIARINSAKTPTTELCGKYARMLVKEIGIKKLCRVDFLTDKSGDVYFNEINTFPGMTDSSLYPKLTESMGLSDSFINLLLSGA